VPELSNALCARDYKGARPEADQGAPVIAFGAQNSAAQGDSVSTQVTPTLDKSKTPAVAVSDPARTLTARYDSSPCYSRGPNFLAQASAVRRLTPVECERLQGFPDDYTQIPWRNKPAENCPDGPRYKAMGNSMAVPVMRWIGERISMVDAL
jgi:DNA (cytosine-5)-methyltransferase 1